MITYPQAMVINQRKPKFDMVQVYLELAKLFLDSVATAPLHHLKFPDVRGKLSVTLSKMIGFLCGCFYVALRSTLKIQVDWSTPVRL